jgi:1,4-alpha-glucan branching enzyme
MSIYTIALAPSAPNSGMGANLAGKLLSTAGSALPAGASFRVWAPNASRVRVRLRPNSASAYAELDLKQDTGNAAYWSADIVGVAAGHHYRFLVDNSGKGLDNPGGPFEHVDPYARDVENSSDKADGLVVDFKSFAFRNFTTPRFEDFLIYQLHVGSFAGLHDGISVVNFTATFTDIERKLDYISGLGFNAVQLLPAGEYPGDTDEGYAPTNFFAPESAFGSPAQLQKLVDECHARGLAVLFDVVYNHVSDADNNLWQFDGNQGYGGGGIYFSGTRAENFGSRPGFGRVEVNNFFLDNARMWFREYGADGLRFDSAHNMAPDSALHDLIAAIAGEFPNKLLIAEHNNQNYCLRTHAFGAAWDLGSADDFRNALENRDLDALRRHIDFEGVSDSYRLVRYLLGSHDQIFADYERRRDGSISAGDHPFNRYFVERVGGVIVGRFDWTARAKARLGWALNAVMPGTPLLFMGSELNHYGYWDPDTDQFGDHRFDDDLRRDGIGLEMQNLVRDANNLRWKHSGLRSLGRPEFKHFDNDNAVLAFKRFNFDGDVLLVVVNLGEKQFDQRTYGVNMPGEGGTWEEIFNSQSAQYGGWNDSGNFLTFPGVENDGHMYIRLPKLAVLVFRKT